ncbi:MAG: enoyl-CoA hydratase/isomerase family protein [Gammaproteobacteria bacterium]|nr:enoyl-CoA hydratase/isomerase family protein [Gammaproteobacteria bacterium]
MPNYQYCDALQAELSETGVLTATLNRPERLNAFDGELREAIYNMLADVREDGDVRALVLTGAGRAFCSGADLGAADQRKWPSRPHEPRFMWCVDLLEMPKPTIAAIHGAAAGGGLGLALLCDIRICSDRARLIPIWNKRAIHPDDLVTWTLPRHVGYSRALTWLYLAEDIPLDEAKSTGLVMDICSPEDLMPRAQALAEKLAAGPTLNYALTKQAVLRGLLREPKDSAMIEVWGQNRASESEDREEGVRAFRERRAPVFKGR